MPRTRQATYRARVTCVACHHVFYAARKTRRWCNACMLPHKVRARRRERDRQRDTPRPPRPTAPNPVRDELLAKYGAKLACAECNRPLTPEEALVRAYRKTGADPPYEPTPRTLENAQAVCRRCNVRVSEGMLNALERKRLGAVRAQRMRQLRQELRWGVYIEWGSPMDSKLAELRGLA